MRNKLTQLTAVCITAILISGSVGCHFNGGKWYNPNSYTWGIGPSTPREPGKPSDSLAGTKPSLEGKPNVDAPLEGYRFGSKPGQPSTRNGVSDSQFATNPNRGTPDSRVAVAPHYNGGYSDSPSVSPNGFPTNGTTPGINGNVNSNGNVNGNGTISGSTLDYNNTNNTLPPNYPIQPNPGYPGGAYQPPATNTSPMISPSTGYSTTPTGTVPTGTADNYPPVGTPPTYNTPYGNPSYGNQPMTNVPTAGANYDPYASNAALPPTGMPTYGANPNGTGTAAPASGYYNNTSAPPAGNPPPYTPYNSNNGGTYGGGAAYPTY